MDRRSWPWRRKPPEKSCSGETESSGTASSHSERFSDDQEALRFSPNFLLPSPLREDSPVDDGSRVHESAKSLTEKLSAALMNISAKEELVRKHAKVAEEAVSGWEKAQDEVAALKQQLEIAMHKNSALEDRIGHLDGALKECVRELRQAREDQEERLHEAISKKALEWESRKIELEKEISAYKAKLLAFAEDLQARTLERDLSVQAAETASKQHLESIKKAARLEAECRRLQSTARKTFPEKDQRVSGSVCGESFTDSHSDSRERLLLPLDNEQSCSDPWASTALITELDQFKNKKGDTRRLTMAASEIDLMDDFLEMERLAALPLVSAGHETDGSLASELDACSFEVVDRRIATEATAERTERAKADLLEAALEASRDKLNELQRQLDSVTMSEQLALAKVFDLETKKKTLKSLLEATRLEATELSGRASLLTEELEIERSSSACFAARAELEEEKRAALESHLDSARLEAGELRLKIVTLESTIREAKASSSILDGELNREMALANDLADKVAALEATRKDLDFQLEASSLEILSLNDKLGSLQRKADENGVNSAMLAAKCKNLEDELSKKRTRRPELRAAARSNAELKLKQDQDLALAAGKLAECQETIASLNKHLELLADFDGFPEPDMERKKDAELDDYGDDGLRALEFEDMDELNLYCNSLAPEPPGMFALPNGEEAGYLPSLSSSSSSLYDFAKVMGLCRNGELIENLL